MIARIAVLCLFVFVATNAHAAPLTWFWSGPVNGYVCDSEPCGTALATVVPLGSTVNVSMTFNFDPLAPALPNPALPCLKGTASVSMGVAGTTYTSGGYVWDGGLGFGPGTCSPTYNQVEVVVPSWVSGGPTLGGSWIPFPAGLDGLWWPGPLTNVQPNSISSQLPRFYVPFQSAPQRFTAQLQAVQDPSLPPVPEPSTLFLMSTGLSAFAGRRMFTRR